MPPRASSPPPASVLLVEDTHADALRATRYLLEAGVDRGTIEHVESLTQAHERLQAKDYEVVLLDLHLGDGASVDHLSNFVETRPSAAFIVLTGSNEAELAEQALARGAQDYIRKSDLTGETLRRAMSYAVTRHQHERAARQDLVARRLIRRLLVDVTRLTGSSVGLRRELGRNLAHEMEATTLGDHLAQYNAMGAGTVQLGQAEVDRFTILATNGIEVTPGAAGPTCYITLGYLETAIARSTGKVALGTEMHCQSQGHPHCQFLLRAKA